MTKKELRNELCQVRAKLTSLNMEFFKLVDTNDIDHNYNDDQCPNQFEGQLTDIISRLHESDM